MSPLATRRRKTAAVYYGSCHSEREETRRDNITFHISATSDNYVD